MEITPFAIDVVSPPQDDLLSKVRSSALSLTEHDVVAVSSKVVSIWQGRCVLRSENNKDDLTRREAARYLERSETPGGAVIHTITNGILVPSAGIDPFGDYYVLWPEKPVKTARKLLEWFKKTYRVKNLYMVMTDSRSHPLRQGVVGFALAWAGFEPLFDNRDRKDLLGNESGGSQVNLPDSLAAAAVLAMGEANERTPIVRMREVPYVKNAQKKNSEPFEVAPEKDIFEPFFRHLPWKF